MGGWQTYARYTPTPVNFFQTLREHPGEVHTSRRAVTNGVHSRRDVELSSASLVVVNADSLLCAGILRLC
jgi:hypothetical protein